MTGRSVRGMIGVWLLACGQVWGQAVSTRVDLVTDHDAVRPGATFEVGVRLRMAPGWHTYWKTPSGSGITGLPTRVEWTLPEGFEAGEMQWPAPLKIIEEIEPVYGYKGTAVLLVPMRVAAEVLPGVHRLQAHVRWLECEHACLLGRIDVELRVQVGEADQPSADATRFEAWRAAIPGEAPFPVRWQWLGNDAEKRMLALDFPAASGAWDFVPDMGGALRFADLPASGVPRGAVGRVFKQVERDVGDWPDVLWGLLILSGDRGGTSAAYAFVATASAPGAEGVGFGGGAPGPDPGAMTGRGGVEGPGLALWWVLGLAFVGGMILNVMPCVLPVIALKVLGFVRQGQETPGRNRVLGGMYALGVLASFLGLAAFVLVVKAAGGRATWGMQFQNPVFLIAMTTLVVVVALNLFGVFEVQLGGRMTDSASRLAQREGLPGAFFGGVLATALATPCSAPFLGVALGYAFVQPAPVVVLVFLAVGAGLAFPFVALAWSPASARFLPRPGPWMVRFKVLMGFPMLGAAVWLFGLCILHYGVDRILWLGAHLVLVALALWILGEFIQRGGGRLAAWLAGAVCLLMSGYVLENEVNWRHPAARMSGNGDGNGVPVSALIDWKPWSPEAVADARAAGRPVFIDFTAKWCATCQDNKRRVIETREVAGRLREIDAAVFSADFTHEDPAIADELARFRRAAVPLVVVYPRRPEEAPRLLPELLTKGRVLETLEWAAR